MTAWHWMACLVFILPPLLAPLGISLQIGMAQCLLSSVGIIAVYTYFSIEFGEGNGTPLQYSCLKNPMDGGAWQAAVHGVAELDTTEWLHFHFSLSCIGEGNDNPLQCSCLENPRDGGAWWAAVYGVVQRQTRLKRLSSSSSKHRVRGCLSSYLTLSVKCSYFTSPNH